MMVRRYALIFLLLVTMLTFFKTGSAQVTVTFNQGLNFGTFYPYGTGGKVIVDDYGHRSQSGNIVLINSSCNACSFTLSTKKWTNYYVYYLRIISPITLTGSNGGTLSVTLNTEGSDAGWYVSRSHPVNLTMGGTITARSTSYNPGGVYSGQVSIIANYN